MIKGIIVATVLLGVGFAAGRLPPSTTDSVSPLGVAHASEIEPTRQANAQSAPPTLAQIEQVDPDFARMIKDTANYVNKPAAGHK